ncbi:Gfo/Idh/MocA family protein [Salinibacter ruber]|uniref:Gfo/Idh/MocA family protein n=1 Tax=Salinibacter ruber TaxID=146919 RepID=UPI002072F31C|nr:Gfo/Idh/MocA family oxidoreductase [Salinibacter ruber]
MAVNWGILGTGNIAHLVAEDLRRLPNAELTAVGSRAQARADTFRDTFDVPHRHGSYEALVADPALNVIHVATPHSAHLEHATLALEAGLAVLCEKPLALNAAQAERLIDTARRHDQFLMEAMWTRFLPVMDDVHRLVHEERALGDVHLLRADIGMTQPVDPTHRLFDPALGGGALLDLGVYPVAFAFDLFGAPDAVTSSAVLAETGVDAQCAAVFRYDDGTQAIWHASLGADAGRTCVLAGAEGRLRGTRAWWKGAPFELTRSDGSTASWARPYEGNGYQFEAAHVMDCLREGRTESPVMPLDESHALLRTMDALRAEWGVAYPQEA